MDDEAECTARRQRHLRRPSATDYRAASMTDRDAFVARFGGVFEASPWIAAAAWERGPYDRVAALHAAMVAIVDGAPRDARRD